MTTAGGFPVVLARDEHRALGAMGMVLVAREICPTGSFLALRGEEIWTMVGGG